MEITKRDNRTYVLTSGDISITAKNDGRGWMVINGPNSLMGRFSNIDAIAKGFRRHLGIKEDAEAIATNPLCPSDIPLAGTVLDPTPPLPRRPVVAPPQRDIKAMLPLPKRAPLDPRVQEGRGGY